MNVLGAYGGTRFAAVRRDQRGAVLFMAVGFMMLAVFSLALVVDTGRLYMAKRNLQRVADMAAIEVLASAVIRPQRNMLSKVWRVTTSS